MVSVRLPDGSQRQFESAVTVAQVAASIGAGLATAALAGKVIKVKFGSPTAGHYVEVQHQNGDVTRYLHLSKIKVEPGDVVGTGEVIALSGNTGRELEVARQKFDFAGRVQYRGTR